MATTGGRRRRGVLEQQILACLATADGPLSPAEVQAALGGELAYTTVMTTLARLHAKHALNRVLDGRAYRYSLADDENAAVANVTAHQMLRLLEGTDREACSAVSSRTSTRPTSSCSRGCCRSPGREDAGGGRDVRARQGRPRVSPFGLRADRAGIADVSARRPARPQAAAGGDRAARDGAGADRRD